MPFIAFYIFELIILLQAATIIPQFAFKLPPEKYLQTLIAFMFNTLLLFNIDFTN